MKIEATGTHWVANGQLEKIPEALCGQVLGGPVVYEVIRVKNGVPVFLKAHLDRLEASLKTGFSAGRPLPKGLRDIPARFDSLVEAENIRNQNIRIVVCPFSGDWYMFPIPSTYPQQSLYAQGVHTEVLKFERERPTVKLYRDGLVEAVLNLKVKTGAFEVLLVDRSGCLTEGSRSNLFFVGDGCVYTAPQETILHGITRRKLMDVLRALCIKCVPRALKLEEIHRFEGAFLTGTSIHVLPIQRIGSQVYGSSQHPVIKKIMEAFEASMERAVHL